MDADTQLTPLQTAVMRSLWRRGEATVPQVREDLTRRQELAPTTVATLLRRLAKRGLVAYRTEGRQYVWRAAVSEGEARKSMVAELSERLFEGDAARLVSHLLKEHEIAPGDLDAVRKMIDEHARREEERS